MSPSKKLLMIGLPETGKTTYLAALWYLIDGQNSTALTLDILDGDREYLNNIRDKWLTRDRLERTKLINEPVLAFKLIDQDSKQSVELTIPDLSGETFKNQWLKRSWTTEFDSLISNSDGALLFIHPKQIQEPTRIEHANLLMGEIPSIETESVDETDDINVEWSHDSAPTQVQLVELLQFIENANVTRFPYKVAVVVSAWDLVKHVNHTPKRLIENRLPLLHQFLTANNDRFQTNIFGVSAQGGEYNEDDKLGEFLDASERIEVASQNYKGHDLTIPLVWLMEENDK